MKSAIFALVAVVVFVPTLEAIQYAKFDDGDDVSCARTIHRAAYSYDEFFAVDDMKGVTPKGALLDITFKAEAKYDVHIMFAMSKESNKTNVMETVVGGWSDSKSCIRNKLQGPCLVYREKKNVLDPNKNVIIRLVVRRDNVYRVYINGEILMEYHIPGPIEINYLSFAGFGTPMTLRIDCSKKVEHECTYTCNPI